MQWFSCSMLRVMASMVSPVRMPAIMSTDSSARDGLATCRMSGLHCAPQHKFPIRGISRTGPGCACPQRLSLCRELDVSVRHHDVDVCLKTARQALALGNNPLNLRQHLLTRIQQPLLLVCAQHQVRLQSGACT